MKFLLLITKRIIFVSILCLFFSNTTFAKYGNKRYYQKVSYKKKSKKVKLHKVKKKGEKFTLYRYREGSPISN